MLPNETARRQHLEVFMRIAFDEAWRLPAGMEPEERAEPVSRVQFWWVIGPDGEVFGKLRAEFGDEEIRLLIG